MHFLWPLEMHVNNFEALSFSKIPQNYSEFTSKLPNNFTKISHMFLKIFTIIFNFFIIGGEYWTRLWNILSSVNFLEFFYRLLYKIFCDISVVYIITNQGFVIIESRERLINVRHV